MAMNLSDGDLEFIFVIYDTAKQLVAEKDRLTLSDEIIRHMVDYGFDIKTNATEIGEHCEYLDKSLNDYLEYQEEEEYDEPWYPEEDVWDE